MPNFRTILELTIKAKTQAEADETGEGAALHLLDTFNDDESIRSGIRYVSGGPVNVIVPVALLSALIDAADCAADEQEYTAERNRKDGEHEGAKACAKRGRAHRRAFREARAFLNRAVPAPRTKHTPAAPESALPYPCLRNLNAATTAQPKED